MAKKKGKQQGQQFLSPTLYLLGQNRLDVLMSFVKEKGLYTYAKYRIFPAVMQIGLHQPECRGEILSWFRNVIRFAIEKLPETQWFDSTLAGLMVCDLLDLQAKELLPDIKRLFDTNLVELGTCGDYASVVRNIVDPRHAGRPEDCILDIYKRFADMKRRWGR